LHTSRAQLDAYAKTHLLSWITDESNADTQLQRNYCRHEVLPVIEREWPSAVSCLARVAAHCAQASHVLEELAQEDLAVVATQSMVHSKKLLLLSRARQENVLRYWLHSQGLPLPSTAVLHAIFNEVIVAKEDATPCVTWEGAEVRRFRDHLYAHKPLAAFDPSMVMPWDLQQPLPLPGESGTLQCHAVMGQGIKRSELSSVLEVRFRQGGEICYLPGRLGGHSLKHLFQEWRVPTWLRDRVPLLYHQGDLVAVVGYCVCDGFAARAGEAGWLINKNISV
jgi:tRNA(Ile)-lysidine synthase